MSQQNREIVVPPFVAEILNRFEGQPTSFPDWEVAGALSDAIKEHKGLQQEQRNGWWAEMTAFRLDPSQPQQRSCWQTHFGPVTTITDKAGKEHHSPSLEDVGTEVIEHWAKRTAEAKHPILRSRYADLIWDLTKPCTGMRPTIEHARIAIDSYIAASEIEPGEHVIDQTQRLTRALELALATGDAERVSHVRDAVLRFHGKHIYSREEHGLWCFAFDALYGNKYVTLDSSQITSMVGWLEECLTRSTNTADPKNLDPWTAKEVALRLARFYHDEGTDDQIRRVVTSYGSAFVHLARQADGILAVGWLQSVYEDYIDFGLKDEAEDLLLLSKAKGAEMHKQMRTTRSSITITKEECCRRPDCRLR